MNGNESERVKTIDNILRLNLANCLIKLLKGGRACDLCREVLSSDPRNAKAYYLLSQALWSMSQYRSSIYYLQKAQRISPNNKDITDKLEASIDEVQKLSKFAPDLAGDLRRGIFCYNKYLSRLKAFCKVTICFIFFKRILNSNEKNLIQFQLYFDHVH